MTLIIQKPTGAKLVMAQISQPMDADAQAYVNAVEVADGQGIEDPVRFAINNFVIGCKADGTWAAIKASCILAGARTLAGALVPLAGTAPTNVNFVSGDYNRKTGLVGDGSTKYLNSNRNNNADPQNNRHIAAYATTAQPSGTGFYIGARASNVSNVGGSSVGSDSLQHFSRSSGATLTYSGSATNGLLAASRSGGSNYIARNGGTNYAVTVASEVPANRALAVFALLENTDTGATARTTARLAFYSIGESLNLALLDARVTNLINAFAAAIP